MKNFPFILILPKRCFYAENLSFRPKTHLGYGDIEQTCKDYGAQRHLNVPDNREIPPLTQTTRDESKEYVHQYLVGERARGQDS